MKTGRWIRWKVAARPIGYARLRAAVRALPPEQRAAIALFHFEELSVAEVAGALDVSPGTVKTGLMHARRKLRAVLGEEERELLRSIGEEPGFFRQAWGLLAGPTGWVNCVMIAAQAITFVAGVWAAWNFFSAREPLDAIHWGIPAAVLVVVSLMIKLAVWPQMEANRLMRELKRIELQIARDRR